MRSTTGLVSSMLLAAAAGGCKSEPPPGPPPTQAVSSMDTLQQQLAERTRKRLGNAQDFQIIVTEAAYPIGTLMREGSTIPVSYSSCVPKLPPPTVPTPSLFPSYAISQAAALDFGLDSAVLSGIADAGAKVSTTNAVALDFKDTGLSVLADQDIQQISTGEPCATALQAGPLWFVRGYVLGRRTFKLTAAKDASARLKATKIANFDVNANADSSVNVSDGAVVGYLQIISELRPIAPAAAASPDASAAVAVFRPNVAAVALAGRVYVQRDRNDASGNDAKVLSALQGASLTVVPQVEKIDTAKMPAVAQVRYFNAGDEAKANVALAELRKLYPSATLVRIRLPSPPGQLEVWLPRAAAPGIVHPAAAREVVKVLRTPPGAQIPASVLSKKQ